MTNYKEHIPLGDGAEFDAIRLLLDVWGSAAAGIGDDAAFIDYPRGEKLVISTDATVEGVHFKRDWMSAEQIGARGATAALSDLAAMAVKPRGLLLSLGLPQSWRAALADLGRGIARITQSLDCPILGGNISAASELSLTFTVLGSAPTPLERRGAQVGDVIFVTGQLGGSGAALRAYLDDTDPLESYRRRFTSPQARIAEAIWLAEQGARAAIDISDGLQADAGHLARASGVSIVLNGAFVPRIAGVTAAEALSSGEEYELIAAFRPDAQPDAAAFGERFGIPLTPIGVAVQRGERVVEVMNGGSPAARGFDHFS